MVSLPDLVRLLIFGFLDELLFLSGSGGALLRGTLPVRYCTSRFAHKIPTWGLPFPGGVALLVDGMLVRSDPSSPDCGRIGARSGVSGSGYKRFRLGRKTPVHEFFRESFGDHSRPRVWKRLKFGGFIGWGT